MSDAVAKLQELIDGSENIVFFGGAGVSTESGIPDFRSVDGLYHQKYDYPPETILSHTFYVSKPKEFFKFYRDKMVALDAKPNKAHLALAKLEPKPCSGTKPPGTCPYRSFPMSWASLSPLPSVTSMGPVIPGRTRWTCWPGNSISR